MTQFVCLMPLPQCGLRATELSVKPGHSKHISISLPLSIFLYISKNIDRRPKVLISISNYLAFTVTTQMGRSKQERTEGKESLGELEVLDSSMPCAPPGL